jgi:DNA-binding transcriptional regulator YiaG
LTIYTETCKISVVSSDKKRQNWDGKRIRALRSHLGLTQTEMAARLGTRQQTISEWEKEIYQPRGTSATLLSIVADGSGFRYDTGIPKLKKGE